MKKEESIENIRHSFAHILAAAVLNIYPKAKLAIGPAIDNGFYYDFDNVHIREEDLPRIESEMRRLAKQDWSFKKELWTVSKATAHYKKLKQEYKLDLIKDLSKGKKSTKLGMVYTGEIFLDLCRGGHVKSTKELPLDAFKLSHVAGAYWRGDEKNAMLTRVYGLAFANKKELKEYSAKLEEAKSRDHRKLGKELGIYMFSDLVGPGLPLYLPKGSIVVQEIENFMKELQNEMGYSHVLTPHLAKEELFMTSGHLQWFKDSMYPPMEFKGEGSYYAKPMNCPFHVEIYKNEMRSYKDLPLRFAEFGNVYRYEQSGELGGLLRVRGFTQDDAHIFCREDQVIEEFIKVFEFVDILLKGLGLTDYSHRLSLPGKDKEKYAGNKKQWDKAISLIRKALKEKKIDFTEVDGEAAFYGPKLDVVFDDALGREWQISTIQVDFLQPERFNLSYIGENGKEQRPYMLHRAPLGSRERIMAILLEHHKGAFPTWLSPEQVWILPLSDKFEKVALKVEEKLKAKLPDLRTVVRSESETLGKKIRAGEKQKIPYILVIGEKEKKSGTVSVRQRGKGDLGALSIQKFVTKVEKEIKEKK